MSRIEPEATRSVLPSVESEEQVIYAIGTICGYAFVVRRGDDTMFDMHRLVHLAMRIWIQREELAMQMTEKAIR